MKIRTDEQTRQFGEVFQELLVRYRIADDELAENMGTRASAVTRYRGWTHLPCSRSAVLDIIKALYRLNGQFLITDGNRLLDALGYKPMKRAELQKIWGFHKTAETADVKALVQNALVAHRLGDVQLTREFLRTALEAVRPDADAVNISGVSLLLSQTYLYDNPRLALEILLDAEKHSPVGPEILPERILILSEIAAAEAVSNRLEEATQRIGQAQDLVRRMNEEAYSPYSKDLLLTKIYDTLAIIHLAKKDWAQSLKCAGMSMAYALDVMPAEIAVSGFVQLLERLRSDPTYAFSPATKRSFSRAKRQTVAVADQVKHAVERSKGNIGELLNPLKAELQKIVDDVIAAAIGDDRAAGS